MTYVLRLSHMKAGDYADACNVCCGALSELKNFVKTELVPEYKDGHWDKVFRKGGALEWFNPPSYCEEESYVRLRSIEEFKTDLDGANWFKNTY